MNCFNCGREVEVKERVGFRDNCPACDRPLHACLNCGFYDPAYNNQCRENQAERVVDKDRANFCEYFALARSGQRSSTTGSNPGDARASLDALFKKKP
jgi:hypothetical protein